MNYDWSPQLCCPAQLQDTSCQLQLHSGTGLGPRAWLKKSISVSSTAVHTTRHLGVWKSRTWPFDWINWNIESPRTAGELQWGRRHWTRCYTLLHCNYIYITHYIIHYIGVVYQWTLAGEVWCVMCVLLKGNPDKIILKHQCLASSLHNWLLAMQLNNLTYHFLSSDPQLQG